MITFSYKELEGIVREIQSMSYEKAREVYLSKIIRQNNDFFDMNISQFAISVYNNNGNCRIGNTIEVYDD